MRELDDLVVSYMEDKLLAPARLHEIFADVLDRRDAQAARAKERVAELRRQAADADSKLTRICEAIKNGVADVSDPNLKARMGELKASRDSARADADRAENRTGDEAARITPEKLQRFAGEAKRRLRKADGAYRRHHIQALAQRVEVGVDEIRITGSRAKLLGTLADAGLASPGVLTARTRVRSFVPNWLRG